MSLRQKIEQLKDDDPLASAYVSSLKKDIARVEQFSKECDKVIASLEDSPFIEKQILALYDAYGKVPYSPDKNDTIGTAATSLVLDEMIARYKTGTSSAPADYSEFVTKLQADKEEKQMMIDTLIEKLESEFESPLDEKYEEAVQLEKLLKSFIKTLNTDYEEPTVR
ncbi:hypothetical protein SBY92_000509 [Candida maltosa Xu316]|uniref:Uncharacterized protein n=1 Tax=Candida maltosa (strain Xu316) TaxID=1245528 RepID=M3K184_CANMX|nr:hypothetical protein G210_0284 [Candida maltosa Xu316]